MSSYSSSDDCHLRCLGSPSSLIIAFVTGGCPLLCLCPCLWLLINLVFLASSPLCCCLTSCLIVISVVQYRRLPLLSSSLPEFTPSGLCSFSTYCFAIASISAEQGRCFKGSPGVFIQANFFGITSFKTRISSLLVGREEV